MKNALVSILTLIVLIGLGMILKWSLAEGYALTVFPLTIVGIAGLTWLVWAPADTAGAHEMWSEIKGWFRLGKARGDR